MATLPWYSDLDLTAGAFSLLLTAAATVLHGGPTLLGVGGPVAGSVPPWDLSARVRKESRTFPPLGTRDLTVVVTSTTDKGTKGRSGSGP